MSQVFQSPFLDLFLLHLYKPMRGVRRIVVPTRTSLQTPHSTRFSWTKNENNRRRGGVNNGDP